MTGEFMGRPSYSSKMPSTERLKRHLGIPQAQAGEDSAFGEEDATEKEYSQRQHLRD